MAILTPAELKAGALWSIRLTDGNGNTVPDAHLTRIITAQTNMLARELDVDLGTDDYVERTDSFRHPVGNGIMFSLTRCPIRSITSVKVQLGQHPVLSVPAEWIDTPHAESGVVQLVPIRGNVSANDLGPYYFLSQTGYLNYELDGQWRWTYKSGFKESDVPPEFVRCVELMAANAFLRQAGDNILGPGIASKSISLGGVSTSRSSTASAMYSGTSAQMNENKEEIKELKEYLRQHLAGVGFFPV